MAENTQIDAYRGTRAIKQHQREMLALVRENFPEFDGRGLDIGCAEGAFMHLLADCFPKAQLTGIDLSAELIALARERWTGGAARFVVADALEFEPEEPYDVVTGAGILSIFEDPFPPLDRWLSWLSATGRLYLFGRFNSAPIDTIIQFRNHYTNGQWEGGLTAFSVETVGQYLAERGWQHSLTKFNLTVKLPRHPDPIRTYTLDLADGGTLVVNGTNVIAEHFFLKVWKD
ncbi:MAG: class I SAM-dependent methyltransferase [Candidatus Eisenbacteria sp.]|nr:class I SAM-dependent methyltransferase [Candidatus Eisenbacteria bacterium]